LGNASLGRPPSTPYLVSATAKAGTVLRKGFPPLETGLRLHQYWVGISGNCPVVQLKPGDAYERDRQVILISMGIILSASCGSRILIK